ncbi:MAG: SPOR domain-containing protein [Sedimenticola sp.]
MKWIFILILLVNLAVFGLGYQSELSSPEMVEVVYPVVGNLRLLSEVEPAVDAVAALQDQAPQKPFVEDEVKATPPVEMTKEIELETQEESATEVAEEPPRASIIPSPEEGEAATLAADDPESMVEPEPEPEPEEVVEETTAFGLATDTSTDPTEVPVPIAAVEALASPPDAVGMVCGAYGPFEKGSETRQVADRMYLLGLDSSLRQESYSKTVGYWVMIPPLESQQAAIQTVQELKEMGIEDIRRFFRGNYQHGVSLGAFTHKSNADNRKSSLVAKGYQVVIKPRISERQAFWLDYRDGAGAGTALFEELLEQYPELDNQIYPCSRIVTSSGIN